ncbi:MULTISPECIES: hypothetical protein [unclassified Bacillus cereus group]|uniref:hypothetical protein n=1 Tax=unclassified Bacillus cereus group TaxID=2750818 RepID=UPI0029C43FFE|nr:hypothetical protein [Bacillus cereus group sp. BfR-BA-02730]MDX5808336.1 hypothetical protein [Bacillus cereus group sp. BfR-BA-02730]
MNYLFWLSEIPMLLISTFYIYEGMKSEDYTFKEEAYNLAIGFISIPIVVWVLYNTWH